MNISIASYSFHGLKNSGEMDVFGYLESCRYRYQLRTADIWNGLMGAPDQYLQPAFMQKVKAGMEERELTLCNFHVDGVHVWEDDAAKRDQHHKSALEHLKAAEFLGAKTVRIDAGGQGHVWTNEQFDLIVKRFKEYCRRAGDGGYKLGPESHWGPELVPDNMERLALAVDHPAFGILHHIGHWELSDEEAGDRRLARFAVHTHVDARTTATCLEKRMCILLEAGYKGCWGVEHHSGKNEYAEVEYQLAEVRRTLGRIKAGK